MKSIRQASPSAHADYDFSRVLDTLVDRANGKGRRQRITKVMRSVRLNDWSVALGLLLMTASLLSGATSSSPNTNSSPGRLQQAAPDPLAQVDISRLQFSAGVGEIVKMVKAKVDPAVITSFINHSLISYHPTAQELIVLKRLGVSSDIVVAMLGHHPTAVRTQRPSFRPPPEMRPPAMEDLAQVSPSPGVYPVQPYPYPTRGFAAVGPLSSFNNSFPTFVNGRPVYSGYYIPSYPVLW